MWTIRILVAACILDFNFQVTYIYRCYLYLWLKGKYRGKHIRLGQEEQVAHLVVRGSRAHDSYIGHKVLKLQSSKGNRHGARHLGA